MRKPLIVDPDVLRRLAELPQGSRKLCQEAIFAVVEAFGQPHLHSGLGIRKLKSSAFECRAGLDLRILFRNRPEGLHISFIGDHDEIQRELRTGKYD